MSPLTASRHLLRVPAPLLAILAVAVPAAAQIPLTGKVFDGSGGPLQSGMVYHATGNLAVPVGQTLTVQAGAIVKFPNARITVDGTLLVNGTALSPAIFTSLQDDTAGGDTNGNGASSGAAAQWVGIVVNSSGTLTADHASVRYAGSNFVGGVSLGGTLTLTNSTIRDCFSSALKLNLSTGVLAVTNCSFQNNGGYAVEGARLDLIPGFSGNTASGNGQGDYIRIQQASLNSDTTIGPGNLIGGVAVLEANSLIPAGLTLRCEPGVIVKWSGNLRQTVDGSLDLAGTSVNPVVYTVLQDDDHGGDTNKNGPSNGSPATWQGVINSAGGSVSMNHAILRYSGGNFVGAIDNSGALTVTNTTLRDSFSTALKLNLSTTVPTVSNCTFQDNGGYAVDGVPLDVLHGFSGNTASGNGQGDYIRVVNGSITSNTTVTLDQLLGDVLVITGNSLIPAGVTLRCEPGVIVKWAGNLRQTVDGSLDLAGTSANPVVYTVLQDDDYGGDTNKNGPSNGSPATWQGVVNSAGGSVRMNHAILRYSGSNFIGAIDNSGVLTVTNTTLRDSFSSALKLNLSVTVPTVTNCKFENNGGYAVDGARLDVLPGFSGNTASGNGIGDYIRVQQASPAVDTTICRDNLLGNVVVITTNASIPAGVTLCLERGIVVKWTGNNIVNISGSLLAKGTGFDPIVFTGIDDDAFGGDTNKNGSASTSTAAAWQGIRFLSSPQPSLLENVRVRYAGSNFIPAVWGQSGSLTLRSVRADFAFSNGFVLDALAGDAENLVAFGCGVVGIDLTSGAFDVLHATCAGNGVGGIRDTGTHVGRVINSISWGNGTGNFIGFAPGEILSSDGDAVGAGSNGNINIDPLFVDATTGVGDLHLQSASPCINVGNDVLGASVSKDHDENSRRLDPTLSGVDRSDMGAHEYALWTMERVSEDLILGGRVRFRVTGPAGTSLYLLGFLRSSSLQSPFGFLTAGTSGIHTLGVVPVGSTYSVPVPNRLSLVGMSFGVQTLTTAAGNQAVGAYTNLYRAKVGDARPRERGKIAFAGGPPRTR